MTTRKPFFETYARARDATCFRCSGALEDICASGFYPGAGAVQGFCEACRMCTYFDTQETADGCIAIGSMS
jgi:hypothetical protein